LDFPHEFKSLLLYPLPPENKKKKTTRCGYEIWRFFSIIPHGNMDKNRNMDRKLIEKVQSGDKAAFKLFFEKHHRNIYRLCYHMLHDSQEAEDMTQEVFLKVFLKIKRFRGESRVSTWLYRIAVNLCLNHLRRKNTTRFLSLDFLLEKGKQPAQEPEKEPPARLTQEEEKTIIGKAVDSLPKNQRTAIILNHYMDFSYEEISETMGRSTASVRSLLFRAKQSLQKKLKNPRLFQPPRV
jgi:RNA polymerase sigma factor (sigma-70 family)